MEFLLVSLLCKISKRGSQGMELGVRCVAADHSDADVFYAPLTVLPVALVHTGVG
jgi:hypothetical protein